MRVYLSAAAVLLLLTLSCGGGQKAPPPVSTDNLIIALDDEHEGTVSALLTLIDVSTGDTVGELTSGYQTWALLRPSAGELLVSDIEDEDFQARLNVYDIADLGSPEWSIDLPDRAVGTIYQLAMSLSADEHYLYYLARVGPCREGAQCDVYFIGVIDLETRRIIASAALPPRCGYAAVVPFGDEDGLALCFARRDLVRVTPQGGGLVVEDSLRAVTTAPSSFGFWRSPVFGGVYGVGRYFMAFGNGDVVFSEAERSPINLLTSEGLRLWGGPQWRLDDEVVLFAAGPAFPEDSVGYVLDTLIVFDAIDAPRTQWLSLPPNVTHLAPIDAGTVALLEANTGTIYLFDLASGEVSGELEAPPDTRWLVGP